MGGATRWPILAGIGFALAALVKINGVFGLAAALLVELVLLAWARRDGPGGWRPHARAMALLVVAFVPAWFGGLWLLDAAFTGFASPVAHLQHILDYGLSLTRVTAINQESYPWQWLINEVQMTYLRTDEQTIVNGEVVGSYATIFFRGAMNPFVIGAAPFAVAYAIFRVLEARDRVGLWVVAWITAMYLPFVLLALVQHRVSYIFYFLPTLPAVATAVALFLRRASLPRLVVWAYLAAVLLGFRPLLPVPDLRLTTPTGDPSVVAPAKAQRSQDGRRAQASSVFVLRQVGRVPPRRGWGRQRRSGHDGRGARNSSPTSACVA